ncbi:MAG: hypothetical protein AAAB35_08625 [Phyllobacterium sp.]|uniref:hypothetical protein n=1 Tax=Phyllobacterium sp. TaxID=1871046 RepID=UPI0030F11520
MDLHGNGKTGKRSAAPLLISIFWLVSTIGASLGTAYLTGPERNVAARAIGSADPHQTRVAHETDNHSTPVERPMRVAALEALHLKIKSGLRADSGPQDALVPNGPRLKLAEQTGIRIIAPNVALILGHDALFSARAPPRAIG